MIDRMPIRVARLYGVALVKVFTYCIEFDPYGHFDNRSYS
jgi:hypothetical protein